jgi:hypothetical protein
MKCASKRKAACSGWPWRSACRRACGSGRDSVHGATGHSSSGSSAASNAALRPWAGVLLFCTDGLASYPPTIKRVLREKLPRTQRGRCQLVEWPRLLLAQVVKQYDGHRVVGVARQIYQGTPAAVAAVIKATQGLGDINTAYIERLNATWRGCLSSLARRTRALSRTGASLQAGAYLVGTVYNFCTEHQSLRWPGLVGGRKWLGRTPAMAAGLTTHCWSVTELLSYRVPPARWRPPKRRGRQSAALKEVIKQWG